jgi:hypothetical protein
MQHEVVSKPTADVSEKLTASVTDAAADNKHSYSHTRENLKPQKFKSF